MLPLPAGEKIKRPDRNAVVGPGHLVADIPGELDDAIRRLLDPDPARRPGPAELARVFRAPSTRLRAAPTAPVVPFVGRDEQLAQLHGLLEEVRSGETRVLHLGGPSGIGKSALIRRFISEIRQRGSALALEGGCHPQESVPYKALDALIDNLARHLLGLDERVVVTLSPRHAGALVHLFPVLGRVPGVRQWPAPPSFRSVANLRRRGFDALRELIGKLADDQPIVLWIDDVQWSDRDSGPALAALLTPPDAPRLLLILTSRDGQEDTPLIDAFDASVTPVEISLGPLSRTESRELARELARGLLIDIDLDSISSESGGSPFLLGELIRHAGLRDHGAPLETLSVAALVKSRLAQLSPEACRLLEVVAVAGQPLEMAFAFDVAGVGQLGHVLTFSLCSQSLLRTETHDERGYLETYHDRIREVAMATLDPETRKARHRELATAIRASRNPEPGALVKHYLAAGDRSEAAHFALLAAEQAERDVALDQAVEMYDVVLALRI